MTNKGMCFVTFNSPNEVQECIRKEDTLVMQVEYKILNAELWSFEQAPPPSDLIWKNLVYQDPVTIIFKRIVVSISLFVVCILLITPLQIIDNLAPIISVFIKNLDLKQNIFFASLFSFFFKIRAPFKLNTEIFWI